MPSKLHSKATAQAKAHRHQERTRFRDEARPGKVTSLADRVQSLSLKTVWTTHNRRRWWEYFPQIQPLLPAPKAKVSEKDLPQAKLQAIEAMQEFGVLVECSRASGMGRWQLENMVRKDSPDQEFRAGIIKARRECLDRLEGAFVARGLAKGGDLSGIFYMKNNLKKYREIQRVELTGKDGVPFNQMDALRVELIARLTKLRGSGGSAGSVGSGSGGSAGSGEIVIEKAAGSRGSGPKLVGSGKPRTQKEA
jgi:hypothetical protein